MESDVPMISYRNNCESITSTTHLPLSTASLKACFMEAMLKAGLNLKKYTPMLFYGHKHSYLPNLFNVQ